MTKKEEIDREMEKIAVVAENLSHLIHSVLLECPSIRARIRDIELGSSVDEITVETCGNCKDETTCTYCLREHELKNYVWNHWRHILSSRF